jgi:hypothetical protein
MNFRESCDSIYVIVDNMYNVRYNGDGAEESTPFLFPFFHHYFYLSLGIVRVFSVLYEERERERERDF